MASRYRLPMFATRIGLPTGSKEASTDGWFYPKDATEEAALKAVGCEADDLGDGASPGANTLTPTEATSVKSLVSGVPASVQYDGQSRVSSITRSGVTTLVTYPDATTAVFTTNGVATTVTLDANKRVITII